MLLRANPLPNIFAEKITIMGLLSMLGLGSKSDSIQDFVNKGAVIIDVRTVGEFRDGHIKGSKNIPLDTINGKLNEIKKTFISASICSL